MEKREGKEQKLTAEEEDQPPWLPGIEEAKEIMKACLNAADGLVSDEHVPNVAIAMYQSVVMMEMERGRADGIKLRKLAGEIDGHAANLLLKSR